jgi:nitrogenase-stabilizing/protective protein
MSVLTKELEKLSSAEDFFIHFDVPYEPRILAACRLHILKRFHDNLDAVTGLDSLDATALYAACRRQLERAYADFVTGPALHQDAFPRLARMRSAFIALSAVRLPDKHTS